MFVLKNSSVCYLKSNDNYKKEIKCMLLNFEGKDTKLSEGDDECVGALAPVHYQKPTGI